MNRSLLALASSLALHTAVAQVALDWNPPRAREIRPCRVQLLQKEVPSAAPSSQLPPAPPPRQSLSESPPARERPSPTRPSRVIERTELGSETSRLEPSDDYPRARPRRRLAYPKPPGKARPASHGISGQSLLEAPVLIRGPQTIAIPGFLQNRDGHFRLSLKCRIEADSSSRIEIWDSTGCPDLDESVRQSFSGRNWYPALLQGKPVACTVRLTVESSWKQGESTINWGGRVPGADLARY